jgi:uncharacterized membrane protein
VAVSILEHAVERSLWVARVALVLNVPSAWRHSSPFLRLSWLDLATGGVGFAVYLVYTELFTVHAICLWCTSAHVLALLLFGVILFGQCLARPLGVSGRASM